MNIRRQPLMLHYGVVLVLCLGYGYFGYELVREQTTFLLLGYALIWSLSTYLISSKKNKWPHDLILGLLFRAILVVALPNLSQDFYRFIWDGFLTAKGLNPYLFSPSQIIEDPTLIDYVVPDGASLVSGMGPLNASHFTNYPPIMQWLFAVPHWLGMSHLLSQVVTLRALIILADLGVFIGGRHLLKRLKMPASRINWYYLNPFIILEFTGNLHFEGVMLCSLTLGLLALSRQRFILTGWSIAMSIMVKLIPLMFLPLIAKHCIPHFEDFRAHYKKAFLVFGAMTITLVLIALPYSSGLTWQHYTDTTALWFTNFEFNASIYYLVRWIGFEWVGYNIIAESGPILSLIVLMTIMTLAWRKDLTQIRPLICTMFWATALYLLLATTVHPWYWATPLLLSLFTPYRFAILGSLLIMVSYTGYQSDGVQEKTLWIALEYIGIYGLAAHELIKSMRPKTHRQAPRIP